MINAVYHAYQDILIKKQKHLSNAQKRLVYHAYQDILIKKQCNIIQLQTNTSGANNPGDNHPGDF